MLGAVGPGQGARGECSVMGRWRVLIQDGEGAAVPQHPPFQLSQDTVLPFCACTAPAAAEAWMGVSVFCLQEEAEADIGQEDNRKGR